MKFLTNSRLCELENNYLFAEIASKVGRYSKDHPNESIISLGIGDVTLPLSKCVTREMKLAAEEMGNASTFKGYPPPCGCDFLRRAIAEKYKNNGVAVSTQEVYISDGAKSDLCDLFDILGSNEVLIPTPVYPVYLDSARILGRRVRLLTCKESDLFLPTPDGLPKKPFVIHLCSPNNPTGAAFSRAELCRWVDFANESGSLIIFDAAYSAFVRNPEIPRSIFELNGARECAIEVSSFSKMSGFTGVRCGWTVIPDELCGDGGVSLHTLWKRRQATKKNGVSYITQRGAATALSPEGTAEDEKKIGFYMENAHILSELLRSLGVPFWGGENSPYIWLKCPRGLSSWGFFDELLRRAQIVGTPGVGFGDAGEGYFRFTSFASRENISEAAERLRRLL